MTKQYLPVKVDIVTRLEVC